MLQRVRVLWVGKFSELLRAPISQRLEFRQNSKRFKLVAAQFPTYTPQAYFPMEIQQRSVTNLLKP